MYKITYRRSSTLNFNYKTNDENLSLLTFAEKNGLELPHGCLSGYCGTCTATLVKGKVKLLDSREICEKGEINLCQAIPLSDCIIDV